MSVKLRVFFFAVIANNHNKKFHKTQAEFFLFSGHKMSPNPKRKRESTKNSRKSTGIKRKGKQGSKQTKKDAHEENDHNASDSNASLIRKRKITQREHVAEATRDQNKGKPKSKTQEKKKDTQKKRDHDDESDSDDVILVSEATNKPSTSAASTAGNDAGARNDGETSKKEEEKEDEQPSNWEKFKDVPLNVLRCCTNFVDLVELDLKKTSTRPIQNIKINKEIEKRYANMKFKDKFEEYDLNRLRWLGSNAKYVIIRVCLLLSHCARLLKTKFLLSVQLKLHFGINQNPIAIDVYGKHQNFRNSFCSCRCTC